MSFSLLRAPACLAALLLASQAVTAQSVMTSYAVTVTCPPVVDYYPESLGGIRTETGFCQGLPTITTATYVYTPKPTGGATKGTNATSTHSPTITGMPTYTAAAVAMDPLPALVAAVAGAAGVVAAML